MARPSLFVRWLRTTALLLTLIGAGATAFFFLHGRRGQVEALFRMLPADTGNVVVVQHLDALLTALNHAVESPDGPTELKDLQHDLRTRSVAQLGFDATRPEGWQKSGIDLAGAFALASSGKTDDPFAFSYLPVSDPTAATALLKRTLSNAGATVEEDEGNGLHVWRVRWPATVNNEPYPPRAFAFQDCYVVVVGATGSADAESALRKQLAGHGLIGETAFRAVRNAVGEPWIGFVYCSPALVKQQLEAQQAQAELGPMAGGGAGAALELADDKLELRIRALADGTPQPSPLAEAHPPNDHVSGVEPLLAGRISLDPRALVAGLKKDPAGQKQLASAQTLLTPLGIDFEKDVVGALDGQLSLALVAPDKGENSLVDLVAVVGAKDAPALLKKLSPSLLPLGFMPGDDGWLNGPGLELGATEDAFLLFGAAPARRTAWKKAVSAGGPPLWAALPNDPRQSFEHGPALYAWANLERAAELVAHSGAPGSVQGARVLRAMQSAALGLDARDGVIRLDADLYPPAGGFSHAFANHPDAGR